MIKDPSDLLARSVDDADIRRYLAEHEATSQMEPELDSIYYSLGRSGIQLLVEGARTIQSVFLYGVGHETGLGPYIGPLPFGLSMDLRRVEVRAALGPPSFEAPAREVAYLGRMDPMERYDLPSCSIHLEYAEPDGKILVVTLMTPEAVPRSETVH